MMEKGHRPFNPPPNHQPQVPQNPKTPLSYNQILSYSRFLILVYLHVMEVAARPTWPSAPAGMVPTPEQQQASSTAGPR